MSPSCFSMRRELPSSQVEREALGTWPLSTLRSSPTEQRPVKVVFGSLQPDRTSGLPSGSSPRVTSGGDESAVVSNPVVEGMSSLQ